jgi:hypothetical protein
MGNSIWVGAFAAIALIGTTLAIRGSSRSWRVAGGLYAVGGMLFLLYYVVCLAGGYEPPADGAIGDAAEWGYTIGVFAILAATMSTLIALGRPGRRRFVVVFAAATITTAVVLFWTSNWAARMTDPATRCSDTAHDWRPGWDRIERVPPGARCSDQGREVFVPADAISWLALGGWSAYYAFLATFPLMGLVWAARRRPILRPA